MNNHTSTPDHVIETAYTLLSQWEDTPNFDLLLNQLRQEFNDEVTDMAATVCRNVFRFRDKIDWLISKCSTKPPRGRIRKLLRIPIAQLLYDNQIPEALICDTAVRYCKKRFNKFDAGYVNKILRSVIEKYDLEGPKNVELNLSPPLVKQWKKHFSEEQIQAWSKLLAKPASMTARLKLNVEYDAEEFNGILEEIDFEELKPEWRFFKVKKAKEFLKKNQNRFYIQDPAPSMSLQLLSPKPGETVADLCAAPGGKSLLIAEKMNSEGELYSCDVSPKRLKTIEENLKDYPFAKIIQHDAMKPSLDKNSFDSILLDVPCSNTGVIRRKTDVRWSFNRKKLEEVIEIQKSILRFSSRLLKTGGRLVYSTCSIDPEENELVIEDFLAKNENFELQEKHTLYPCEHHDGAFAALLVKKADS
ncbi:MAG: methyltransferase domain-containing protein [Lentisphaeraceae bacterium]|nr:methyltransferase domain-containing protein [Lentisphaeraceae bacterium]